MAALTAMMHSWKWINICSRCLCLSAAGGEILPNTRTLRLITATLRGGAPVSGSALYTVQCTVCTARCGQDVRSGRSRVHLVLHPGLQLVRDRGRVVEHQEVRVATYNDKHFKTFVTHERATTALTSITFCPAIIPTLAFV